MGATAKKAAWNSHRPLSFPKANLKIYIIGMRNRLIHAYFEINTEMVWQTVTQEIPVLLPQLRALATDE